MYRSTMTWFPWGFKQNSSQELKWSTRESCREFFIEMVLDRATPSATTKTADLKPAKDATVKRVNMGRDTSGSIQNMPEGRNFLVRIVGKLQQVSKEIYSPWTRAITLSPKTRDKDLGNLDPMNMPRSLSIEMVNRGEWRPFQEPGKVIWSHTFRLKMGRICCVLPQHLAKVWTATTAHVRIWFANVCNVLIDLFKAVLQNALLFSVAFAIIREQSSALVNDALHSVKDLIICCKVLCSLPLGLELTGEAKM